MFASVRHQGDGLVPSGVRPVPALVTLFCLGCSDPAPTTVFVGDRDQGFHGFLDFRLTGTGAAAVAAAEGGAAVADSPFMGGTATVGI